MGKIEVVCWDVDKVWYPDISTSYCINKRHGSPAETMRRYKEEGLFTEADVARWQETLGQGKDPFASYPAAGAMLTDFLYKMKREGSEEPVISKADTIRTKQGLLKGMTLQEVRGIALDIYDRPNPGLREAINEFRRLGLYQVAFSDGLGPFILYQTMWRGMENVGVPTAILADSRGGEFRLNEAENRCVLHPRGTREVKLTGKVEKSDKAADFLLHMAAMEYPLSSVAVIDDSGANVKNMLVPVRDAGGLAVGFRPTDAHRKTFEEHRVPVITNLYVFADIVKNPSEIESYAE